jgi:hypothetical protein
MLSPNGFITNLNYRCTLCALCGESPKPRRLNQ